MMATRLFLDGVEAGDASDRFLGDRRGLALDDVDELAPDVGEAGDLAGLVLAIELVEARIAVGMDPASIAGQMFGRMLAFAIDREPVPDGRWIGTRPGPLIADIGPDAGGLGLAVAWQVKS
jgi:hypothetical protein